jgi:hypothetical protein
MTKIERLEEALAGARHALGMIQRNLKVATDTDYLNAIQNELDDILNPPPEYEEIPITRWAVVAPSGYVEQTFSDEDCANSAVLLPKYENYAVAKLTGTVRREKVAPVERSVTVDCKINQYGAVHSSSSDLCLLRDYPEFHNSKGSITFTTTDPPK